MSGPPCVCVCVFGKMPISLNVDLLRGRGGGTLVVLVTHVCTVHWGGFGGVFFPSIMHDVEFVRKTGTVPGWNVYEREREREIV